MIGRPPRRPPTTTLLRTTALTTSESNPPRRPVCRTSTTPRCSNARYDANTGRGAASRPVPPGRSPPPIGDEQPCKRERVGDATALRSFRVRSPDAAGRALPSLWVAARDERLPQCAAPEPGSTRRDRPGRRRGRGERG